jgi:hypothetical protein
MMSLVLKLIEIDMFYSHVFPIDTDYASITSGGEVMFLRFFFR